MDTLTTVAIAIAAFLVLVILTAIEFKTASVMHTQKKGSSPQRNSGENGCNTDKNECNSIEDECDDVPLDKEN